MHFRLLLTRLEIRDVGLRHSCPEHYSLSEFTFSIHITYGSLYSLKLLSLYINDRPPLWFSGKEFLATDPEVWGSIPGAIRFSEN
jgi:hypothetical protein